MMGWRLCFSGKVRCWWSRFMGFYVWSTLLHLPPMHASKTARKEARGGKESCPVESLPWCMNSNNGEMTLLHTDFALHHSMKSIHTIEPCIPYMRCVELRGQ
jgi:hypothetical protein